MKFIVSFCLLAFTASALAVPVDVQVSSEKAKLLQVSHANDDFDARLLAVLEAEKPGENVFISAFSVNSVMAMIMAGGVNSTYKEIYNTLGFANSQFSQNDILTGYKALLHEVNHPAKVTGNILQIANLLALQKNRPVLESFLSSITNNFEAKVFVEDFVTRAKESTAELNSWANEKTHGKIQKLYDKPLPASTVMVLMNAVYFKGTWDVKFDAKRTKPEAFHVTRSHSEMVPLMAGGGRMNYAQFEDGQLLELPYKNKTLSMYVFLPKESFNTRLSTALSSHKFNQRVGQLHRTLVNLHLPKFKFSSKYDMTTPLKSLGIHKAFTAGAAEFSNINGHKDLFLSGVVQKTFIDVNEEGSEAAAVTGGHIHTTSVHRPETPVDFRVDRPFMFFIRDNVNQLTLFSGIINKPETQK